MKFLFILLSLVFLNKLCMLIANNEINKDPIDVDTTDYSNEDIYSDKIKDETNINNDKNEKISNTDNKEYTTNKEKVKDQIKVDYEQELRLKQAESLRIRKLKEREIDGENAVRRTIYASSNDLCDWKTQPISFIKGEVCGSHYKVLGIDRKNSHHLLDKNSIKKRYRQLSLTLHPDKNPSDDADVAFNVLQEAYNCLLDEKCKNEYDNKLSLDEEDIKDERIKFKEHVMNKSIFLMNKAHYYVSLASNHIYHAGIKFWDIAGEWHITIMEENYPIGRPLAIIALLIKGQFLLKVHALSYLIIRINYEIAKARGAL